MRMTLKNNNKQIMPKKGNPKTHKNTKRKTTKISNQFEGETD